MPTKLLKFNKTQWKNFFKVAFDLKNVEFYSTGGGYIDARSRRGCMGYDAWILSGRVYVQFSLDSCVIKSAYFNIETFEYDYEFTEKEYKLSLKEQEGYDS